MIRPLLIISALLATVACTKTLLTVDQAMAQCTETARAATRPTGGVSIGANSQTGLETGFSIGFTSDFLTGRDPLEVYNECVINKSGQAPTRPLRL